MAANMRMHPGNDTFIYFLNSGNKHTLPLMGKKQVYKMGYTHR